MILHKKIKAGALQYVLVISVIIAIIIFAFISLIYLQQRLKIKYDFSKEAIANVQMGFDYLKNHKIEYDKWTTLELSNNELATTKLKKSHWGIYDVVISKSQVKNEFFQKIGLVGGQNKSREALYVKDNNQSLVVVGNTKIIGDALVPKQGVKSGNISGVSYYGNQLIYGNQQTSDSNLPEPKNLKALQEFYKNINQSKYEAFELQDGLEKHQSFSEKTLIFQSIGAFTLYEVNLNGNIIIRSQNKIIVHASSKLQDVILLAPEILIEEGFKGNFQAIAFKKIEVQSNVELAYPSALIVLEEGKEIQVQSNSNNQKNDELGIFIEENTEVRGVVLYHSENTNTNYFTQIHVAPKTKVIGEVYCSHNLELEGDIEGSVYTSNFIVRASGGVYINHLLNSTINVKELPKQYAGLFMRNQHLNQVAKWVD